MVHGVHHRGSGGQHLVVIAAGPADREVDFVVYDPVQHVSEQATRRRTGYVRYRHYVTCVTTDDKYRYAERTE